MENKTLLNETLESGMESLKTMKPGSEEYAAAVNSLAKLHEMQMNETAEENSKTAKEDELQLNIADTKSSGNFFFLLRIGRNNQMSRNFFWKIKIINDSHQQHNS